MGDLIKVLRLHWPYLHPFYFQRYFEGSSHNSNDPSSVWCSKAQAVQKFSIDISSLRRVITPIILQILDSSIVCAQSQKCYLSYVCVHVYVCIHIDIMKYIYLPNIYIYQR